MTLVLEIAAGIVLGVAVIAVIAIFWEVLLTAVAVSLGLALAVGGIFLLYSVCGTWEMVAVVLSSLAVMGAISQLGDLIDRHEKYGPPSRAIAKTVAVAIIVATFTSILFGIPLSIWAGNAMGSQVEPYLIILPGLVASAFAARFYYKHAAQKELTAAREKSA